MHEIEAVARRIAEAFDPDRIVLFGSYATGLASEDSDVDLLVVLPFTGRGIDKAVEIRGRVRAPFPMDLLARRPDDTARRYMLSDPLVREALDHGKVLYERPRA